MPILVPSRRLRAAIAAAGLALALPLHAQSVALSFDDGPSLATTPRLSPQARNEAMLAALAKHKVKAALFVTAGNGATKPEGLALARAWGEAGHAVANHTMTHPDLMISETRIPRPDWCAEPAGHGFDSEKATPTLVSRYHHKDFARSARSSRSAQRHCGVTESRRRRRSSARRAGGWQWRSGSHSSRGPGRRSAAGPFHARGLRRRLRCRRCPTPARRC